jgi:hypothetical protein
MEEATTTTLSPNNYPNKTVKSIFGLYKKTESGCIQLRDPITAFRDWLLSAKRNEYDFNEGVWVGKKPLSKLGGKVMLDCDFLEKKNWNIAHYAVRIDGFTYTLHAEMSSGGFIKVIILPEEKNKIYIWKYKGKARHNKETIDSLC